LSFQENYNIGLLVEVSDNSIVLENRFKRKTLLALDKITKIREKEGGFK